MSSAAAASLSAGVLASGCRVLVTGIPPHVSREEVCASCMVHEGSSFGAAIANVHVLGEELQQEEGNTGGALVDLKSAAAAELFVRADLYIDGAPTQRRIISRHVMPASGVSASSPEHLCGGDAAQPETAGCYEHDGEPKSKRCRGETNGTTSSTEGGGDSPSVLVGSRPVGENGEADRKDDGKQASVDEKAPSVADGSVAPDQKDDVVLRFSRLGNVVGVFHEGKILHSHSKDLFTLLGKVVRGVTSPVQHDITSAEVVGEDEAQVTAHHSILDDLPPFESPATADEIPSNPIDFDAPWHTSRNPVSGILGKMMRIQLHNTRRLPIAPANLANLKKLEKEEGHDAAVEAMKIVRKDNKSNRGDKGVSDVAGYMDQFGNVLIFDIPKTTREAAFAVAFDSD